MRIALEVVDDYTGGSSLVQVVVADTHPVGQVMETMRLLRQSYQAGPGRAPCRARGWVWTTNPAYVVCVTGDN